MAANEIEKNGRMVRVSVRLTPLTLRRIENITKTTDIKFSTVLQNGVEMYLRKFERKHNV